MFAVPEADDNVDVSSSAENMQPSTDPEVNKEATLPSSSSSSPPVASSEVVATTDTEEKVEIKSEVSPPAPPPPSSSSQPPVATASKQHRSRLSLFHRNTIHVCDQIVDRV